MATDAHPGAPDTGESPRLPGLVGALVHGTASGLARREPGRPPGALRRLTGIGRRRPRGGGEVLTPAEVERVDTEQMARGVVSHYTGTGYPAVVLGSPHGSAAHLAVALGAAWLPAAFDVTVAAPTSSGGPASAWMRGAAAAARIMSVNPHTSVRQVVGPGIGGLARRPVTLYVRWRQLPDAYARFLGSRLRPGAPILMVRDAGTWVSGYTAQAVNAEFVEGVRQWATGRGHPLYRVVFNRPDVFSAAVADVYRRWLRGAGKTGNRLVVECGRLLDPWQVLRAGLVPYWLPGPSRHGVRELHWWLAGSEPYTQVDVLIEPPGAPRDDMTGGELASLADFAAAAAFATFQGRVDEPGARAYPDGEVPPWRATELLRRQPYDLPVPACLPVLEAVSLLGETTEVSAMIVH